MRISDKHDVSECASLLRNSVVLSEMTTEQLEDLSKLAVKMVYKRHDVVHMEKMPQSHMYTLALGEIRREKTGPEGKVHVIDTTVCGTTVGSLHVLNRDPAFATARCNHDTCVAYRIASEDLNNFILARPDAARNMVVALANQVRQQTKKQRTPLFEQRGTPLPVVAVSLAAGIESFYRAGMNAVINQSLLGGQRGAYFPNMHIQVPTRICYIVGFKGLRQLIETRVKPDDYAHPFGAQVATAVAPGIFMTPISSVLEATNAGNLNPEPLARRWMRGIAPRLLREIIFGIGLNQLSDFCEERVPNSVESPVLKNMLGSFTAGLLSGYLSHVPHNLSTLMLNYPNKPFMQHFREYVLRSEARLPAAAKTLPPPLYRGALTGLAMLAPPSFVPRTIQIAGSFIILNGTINLLSRHFPNLYHLEF